MFSLLSIVLFDFEYLLLENEFSVLAQKIGNTEDFKQQTNGSIPELDTRWYRGYGHLPTWIQERVSIHKLGAIELFTDKDGHYHMFSLRDESSDKFYLVLDTSSYLISKVSKSVGTDHCHPYMI
ncbi:hypothetical protein H5202_11180 [Shewanella sp. SG41-4]|uniref:hypothetical protein n=1 Tax=Shewanella sp. SG41-4 TaxID=2760976 RepID=UPI001603FC45|nr:hypothetical protein [Shewanella sp. SG41-4]MBB1439232.1 hypothetical protein [Shewanella sp. SG41-4]